MSKVDVRVPERPVIELLVDDRNTIQHRFGFPNSDTVFYYLEQVIAFFKRFVTDEYGVDLAEVMKLYVSEKDLALFGLTEKPEDKYAFLDELFALSPEPAVLQAYNLIESKFLQIMPEAATEKELPRIFWRYRSFPHVLDDLVIRGFIPSNSPKGFDLLREMRNRAAHVAPSGNGELKEEWVEALKVAKDFLTGLDKAIEAGYTRREPISEANPENQQ